MTHNQELVGAACKGDIEAVEALLLQYQPSITRFARKYCATPQDVEDAVQETLWVIYRKIGTLRASAAFTSWVFQIVRNQCYYLLKHSRFEYSGFEISRLDYLEFVDDNPELLMLLKQDVVKALTQMPETYRQVLVMRDIENLTAPEAALALGITVEAVKSRLHRARNLLSHLLEDWHV
jgi:RNA polymerase sigma factor (sigma-70 family)